MAQTILFVEDEIGLQKALNQALIKEGYEVIFATDGEKGFQLAKSQRPDLILLDLILPRLSGFGVLEKLKADNETKDIPVIVLTNLENLEDIERAFALGAKTYLVKAHYSLEEVIKKIKETLGQ